MRDGGLLSSDQIHCLDYTKDNTVQLVIRSFAEPWSRRSSQSPSLCTAITSVMMHFRRVHLDPSPQRSHHPHHHTSPQPVPEL